MLLKKIAVAIERKQDSLFTYPKEKQEAYIKKLGKPADEIERGYFQYRCQMKLYGWLLFAVLNCVALPMSLLYLIQFSRKNAVFESQKQCLFVNNGIPVNIVPKALQERYEEIVPVQEDSRCLDDGDWLFLKNIFKRYPFSWMFWMKILHKLSHYSAIITKYNPSAILCCDEFSYTSSVMTKYCRERGIQLINVMHGEKLYFMRDAFVCYDEYYVWNEYYKNLLIELGADPSQFRIEEPDSLKIPYSGEPQKKYDYTYYLGAETGATLKTIAACMEKLQSKGYKVAVRPHPRYTDLAEAQDVLTGMEIEDTKKITIEQSLLRTVTAISLYSTALNQAYHNGVKIVIDDCSNFEKFQKLSERKYFMVNAEHRLLSEITEEGTL